MALPTAGLTFDDLCRLFPDDEVQRELDHGRLVVTGSPNVDHEDVVAVVQRRFQDWAWPRGGRVYVNVDVVFAEDVVTRPDAFLLTAERRSVIVDGYPRAAPNVVVEVSSRTTRGNDLGWKLGAYDEFDVPEYWFFDRRRRLVEVRSAGRYDLPVVLGLEDVLTSPQLEGFALPVAACFAPPQL